MRGTILAVAAAGLLLVPTDGDARRTPKQTMAAKLAKVSYIVPGTVEPIRQPTDNTCWATAATMMYGWRHNSSNEIADVMKVAGPAYVAKFSVDDGIGGGEKGAFLNSMNLRWEAPMSYSITGWETLLRKYGPLWVTTAEGSRFSIHARVIVGISGDGTAAGTMFTIVDPGDGKVHSESVATFTAKFEKVAQIDLGSGAELRPQVVHY